MSLPHSSRISAGLRALLILLLLGGLGVAGSASAAAICRVTTTGSNSADGSAWTQAMDLQTALANSATCPEIWVAAGEYTPAASDRTVSFNILPGVQVYGGFSGGEYQRSDRHPVANVTILSGDLIGDDGADFANNGDNSYHVVFMDGTLGTNITASTMLDGFTISGSNADGSSFPNDSGGGLYCKGSDSGHVCSPSLDNLTFTINSAGWGGAIYNDGGNSGTSSPSLSNVTFRANAADAGGGAMYNFGGDGGTSSPSLSNVTFSGNTAGLDGGAMYNFGYTNGTSSPTLSNVTFSGNHASGSGGAMENFGYFGISSPSLDNVTFSGNTATHVGGAISNSGGADGTSNPNLSNVTFSGNNAGFGGAIYSYGTYGTISNATFSGNTAGCGGAMIYDGGSPSLSNVIAWGDTATRTDCGNPGDNGPEIYNSAHNSAIDHSVIQGSGGSGSGWDTRLGSDGGGNLATNPELGALADNGGATQTMLLGVGSSAIDAGNDYTCMSPPVNGRDQRGVVRPQGPHCDIGAAEAVPTGAITIDAVGGSGQQTGVWMGFFNPLVVRVRDSLNRVMQNVRVQALPVAAGQPGAACSAGITDNAGSALLYCRANGVVGGPYAIKVVAVVAPTAASAIFLLTNTAGDGDLIFRDGFDPLGPRTSIMAAGVSSADFALTAPGNLPDGVTLPLRIVTNAEHQRLALVEVRQDNSGLRLRVTRYTNHGQHAEHGKWSPASTHPQLHVAVSGGGARAYLR